MGMRLVDTPRVSVPRVCEAVPSNLPFSKASLVSITKLLVDTASTALGTSKQPVSHASARFIVSPYERSGSAWPVR